MSQTLSESTIAAAVSSESDRERHLELFWCKKILKRPEYKMFPSRDIAVVMTILILLIPAKSKGAINHQSNVNSTKDQKVRLTSPSRPEIIQAGDGEVLDVQEGHLVLLECTCLSPRPNVQLVWSNGKVAAEQFDIREDIRMLEDGLTWKTSSLFKFVPLEDLTVVCIAHGETLREQESSRPLQLRLHRNPKVTLTSSTVRLEEGGEGSFYCETSSSNVTFKWFLDNNEIAGEHSRQLRLVDLGREQDGASLTCQVENWLGKGEDSLVLEVNFPPKIFEHPQSFVARKGQQVSRFVILDFDIS